MINANLHWYDVYSIGHKTIDREHKKIFELANSIDCANGSPSDITKALDELLNYTENQFSIEEKYMKTIHYDKLDSHIALHKNIVKALDDFIGKVDQLSKKEVACNLRLFIENYIIKHIIIEDKKVHHFRKTTTELRHFFAWNKMYEIGCESIDNEHKMLFNIAIKALNHHRYNNPKRFIKLTVHELYNYMKTHFKNEEEFMEKIGYSGLDEHKKLHEEIVNQMNNFLKQMSLMHISTIERRLIESMDIWFITHILYEDKKINMFLEREKEKEIQK